MRHCAERELSGPISELEGFSSIRERISMVERRDAKGSVAGEVGLKFEVAKVDTSTFTLLFSRRFLITDQTFQEGMSLHFQTLTNNGYQPALQANIKISVFDVNDSDRGMVGDSPLTGRHQTPNHFSA